jgi:hypothetical protein
MLNKVTGRKLVALALGAAALTAATPASAGTAVSWWIGDSLIGWAIYCDNGGLWMWGGSINGEEPSAVPSYNWYSTPAEC